MNSPWVHHCTPVPPALSNPFVTIPPNRFSRSSKSFGAKGGMADYAHGDVEPPFTGDKVGGRFCDIGGRFNDVGRRFGNSFVGGIVGGRIDGVKITFGGGTDKTGTNPTGGFGNSFVDNMMGFDFEPFTFQKNYTSGHDSPGHSGINRSQGILCGYSTVPMSDRISQGEAHGYRTQSAPDYFGGPQLFGVG